MYPFIRMFKELAINAKAKPLPITGVHVSHHICWPWDLDLWRELNNGRTLTLYDLGRIPLAGRTGLTKVLLKNRWGLTMAGASVRYRKRIRMMAKFETRSRLVGWDDRFFYVEQSMWLDGECANQIVYRSAVTGRRGIVPSAEVTEAMGFTGDAPDLPRWVQAWIDADAERPWPPEMPTENPVETPAIKAKSEAA